MAKKKFFMTITPYWLLTIGKSIGELKNAVEYTITLYEMVSKPLVLLSLLRDSKSLESIGKEANRWWSDLYDKYSSEENATLDPKDRDNLKLTIARWEERLYEISKNWILSYPDTHIDIGKLREGAKAFLSDGEFGMLEPLEEQSLKEAASSLLLANFTSAEFMALRTAESLLKKWYEKTTSKKLGRTTWGEVLDKLNEEFPEKERPKELLLLDYLRERRNEIAHPGALSNSVQASTTFFNVISLCQALYFKQD